MQLLIGVALTLCALLGWDSIADAAIEARLWLRGEV